MRRFALVAALVLAGCAAAPVEPAAREAYRYRVAPGAYAQLVRAAAAGEAARPAHVLVLSGGGANGAWGAGFLAGFTASGKRPAFDVVTGVSTGALQATFAFLGEDAPLESAYTRTTNEDVQRSKCPLAIPFSNSFRDTTPLRALIASYLTDDVIERVAARAAGGRTILAATVDLDAASVVVWDLGRIAKDGGYELYRTIVLASASAPVLYPPVEIGGALHVDAGAREQLFFRTYVAPAIRELGGRKAAQSLASQVYVIVNGPVGLAPLDPPLENRLVPIAERTVACLLDANLVADVRTVWTAARDLGMDFHLTFVPEGVPGVPWFDFDPVKMSALFESGKRRGAAEGWARAPYPFEP